MMRYKTKILMVFQWEQFNDTRYDEGNKKGCV